MKTNSQSWESGYLDVYEGSPKLSNSSELKSTELKPLHLSRAIPLGLALGTFIIFVVAGNILVILSVVCNRHLRSPTNYFIVNLAIADLLLSTTVLPVSATLEILGYWVFGRIFCDVWAAVDVLCCTASIMSLCVISIDRYIGVSHPLQYPNIVTGCRALLAMLGVWVLSLVISIGPLLGWKEPPSPDHTVCVITEEPFYALFSSLGSFYIPLIVILGMYCRVYVVVKRTTKNLEAGVKTETMNSGEITLRIHRGSQVHEDSGVAGKGCAHQGRNYLTVKLLRFSREKKAAKTLGVVVGMFTLCWLPFFFTLPIGRSFLNTICPPPPFMFSHYMGYVVTKKPFIRILKCRCHHRRRPGWRAYNYQGAHINSFYSRQDSKDSVNYGSYLNGSQRTLSSASPSPSYHTKGLSHFQEDRPRHARSRTPSVLSESILDHHLEPVEEDPTQSVGNPDQDGIRNWPQEQLKE
uniref:Adrenoceptor alpha 1Bb n=1 Tax=Sinocyclocheilus grahami TaxID=75366 RepID=A0A672QVP4_SINGR